MTMSPSVGCGMVNHIIYLTNPSAPYAALWPTPAPPTPSTFAIPTNRQNSGNLKRHDRHHAYDLGERHHQDHAVDRPTRSADHAECGRRLHRAGAIVPVH